MKKLICLFLSIAMMLFSASAFAEAAETDFYGLLSKHLKNLHCKGLLLSFSSQESITIPGSPALKRS